MSVSTVAVAPVGMAVSFAWDGYFSPFPFSVWARECRWQRDYWACIAAYGNGPDAYRVLVHQREVARDFEENSVGLHRGREIVKAREAAAAHTAAASPSPSPSAGGGGTHTTGGGGTSRNRF